MSHTFDCLAEVHLTMCLCVRLSRLNAMGMHVEPVVVTIPYIMSMLRTLPERARARSPSARGMGRRGGTCTRQEKQSTNSLEGTQECTCSSSLGLQTMRGSLSGNVI